VKISHRGRVMLIRFVIQNTFALPDFRKNRHTMLLVLDKTMAKRLKEGQKTDKIIIMRLKNKQILKIEHATDITSLRNMLEK
jgi:hypothetical protein